MMGRMSPRPLLIVGAGGFGREVADVVDAINAADGAAWEFLGYVDDGVIDPTLLERRGDRLLGTSAALHEHRGASFAVGVGDPKARRLLDARAREAGLEPATLIHPSATLGRDVVIGDGSVICAHVSLTTHIVLGRHTHLNLNCTVGHDVVMGDFVTVNPGATISGNVTLADDVTIGTNAAVIQGISVGAGSTVGAGAAVVRDVAPGTTVVGVPAKPLGG
jgi:sugar O-acyltransferase (sialic acid O-acetyltransferase NeuD family)